ncbi:hypothetical protein SCHIN_v1c07460 [Spiroplasma chinense]|uniref:Pr6Pr family membrane protein n=1 Tax=Spiroplasma chinense TaxID=216932 RepID=A0A5B9Y4H4_9MOLU|nr:Pr6Pr family membrane protein [Spiroplasma chinense]QEH61941.1 hypothetical protein SCHIN_v1c07460 [Spiroplasma chinense]
MDSKKIRLIYKWVFGLLSAFSIIFYYIYNLVDGQVIATDYFNSYETYTIDYFTTFTLLSNVLVCVWFLVAAIDYKKEGQTKILSQTTANCVAVMITVTALIWNFILVPLDDAFPSKPIPQTANVINHIISPIAYVVYVLVLMPNKININLNDFFLKKFWIHFTLVISYCIYAMVRGEMRYHSGPEYKGILYPYFFLNIHGDGLIGIPGVGWFFIAFFLILGIMIGFSYLYNWINNKVCKAKYYQKSFKTI